MEEKTYAIKKEQTIIDKNGEEIKIICEYTHHRFRDRVESKKTIIFGDGHKCVQYGYKSKRTEKEYTQDCTAARKAKRQLVALCNRW